MINRKHFKIKKTATYRGYTIKIRKGDIFFVGEILDENLNYVAKTAFRMTAEDALDYAKQRIDTLETL